MELFSTVAYVLTYKLVTAGYLDDSEIIPEDYNRFTTPTFNGHPVSVYISCQVLGIDNIKEATMDFRLILAIISTWKDPRLKLSSLVSDYPVVFPGEGVSKIWIPELAFPNSKKGEKFDIGSGNAVLKILPDESLYYVQRLNFLVSCPMELHNFPMDVQDCSFVITFRANTDKEAILRWMGETNSPYKNLGKSIHIRNVNLLNFEMKEVKTLKITEKWVSGNFTELIATFKLIRRLTGNIINVYIPSTLVVMLSWLSFWIDVNAAPARITLGVTSILTLVTQIVQSRNFVPPVDYLKALDIWFIFCVIQVFASLVEYALAYQYVRRKKEDKVKSTAWVDQKSRNFAYTIIKVWIDYVKNKTQFLFESKNVNVYDRIARCIFPFIFLIFSNLYWIYYLSKR